MHEESPDAAAVEETPETRKPFELDPEQADAVWALTHERCSVITGGPGRGKTRCLQSALPKLGGKVALCAPSGKAARRMAELTGHPAGTVHRLLGLQRDGGSVFSRGNPLPYDVVVVDEASTLESWLCHRLLEACDPSQTRVHFIGDVDQLPSVGPGQVLHDLIESGRVPVVRLKTMHRSAADSWVCTMAPEILEGRISLAEERNFMHVEADDYFVEQVADVAGLLCEKIGREGFQVIVPLNVGPYGAKVLNEALQPVINGAVAGSYFSGAGARIYEGDEVVVIANDYDRGVFNGETGRVLGMEAGLDGIVGIDFGDRQATYKKSEASEYLRLAYALTVHKMQGSEVPWVVLALHGAHSPLLSRKLLYTAVTRARTGVIIVGQKDAVYEALRREDSTRRYTTLRQRLMA